MYADLLFGVREPEGIIQKEQARSAVIDALQWKDLAGDQGASPYVRLIVQALMEDAYANKPGIRDRIMAQDDIIIIEEKD